MPKAPHQPNDRSQRQLFVHARMVEDLLRGFIHEPWIDQLDFSTLRPWPTDFISEDLEDERRSDVIWEIGWGERRLLIFILMEFQAITSWSMPVRMMVYVGLFYQRLLKSKEWQESKQRKLPPVLPIVLYNGDPKWSAPMEVSELIEVPEDSGLAVYCPRLRYLLLDEQHLKLEPMPGLENVVSAIFELVQGPPLQRSQEIFETMARWLQEPKYEALRRDLASWLQWQYLPSRGMKASEIPRVKDLQELLETLETKMQTWPEQLKQEGRLEGRQEGRQEGRREVLLRQLESKFGPLDAASRSLVNSVAEDQLLLLAERLLFAQSLADVFRR